MVKKHTQRRRRNQRHHRSRKQRGGSPNYGYGGEIIRTGSGAPLEAWSHSDPHCDSASSLRPAPMIGGRRSRRQRNQRNQRNQRGGGCGCMGQQRGGDGNNIQPGANVWEEDMESGENVWDSSNQTQNQTGGSSGNGGYSMVLSNENGKMFDGVMRGACPAPQVGGDPKQLIQSYPAGHGMINPYNSNNANFLDYEAYGRQCMGGGKRKNRKTKNRRSRKHH